MGFFDRLTGKTQAEATLAGSELQSAAADKASGLLDPFQQIGEQGLNQANLLTDPQAQFDFLQNNPLFQESLSNANRQTNQQAASRGRLSSGDTLQQLSNNVLLSASPLISQQKQSIGDLLNFGQSTAFNQGNLLTGQAAVQAGGLIGAENARAAGAQNIFDTAANFGAAPFAFSDPKLKKNIIRTGKEKGYTTYSWEWNEKANLIGLSGAAFGVMADEVKAITPDAVIFDGGYMKVNYEMIGVNHGTRS